MGGRFRALLLGGRLWPRRGRRASGLGWVWRPCNDYDAFVIVDRLEPGMPVELLELAKSLEKQVEVEVELWPVEEQAAAPALHAHVVRAAGGAPRAGRHARIRGARTKPGSR